MKIIGDSKHSIIVFDYIGLIIVSILTLTNCAGPIMETIPTRPSVVEKDLGEAPTHIELIYRVYPGEVHKFLVHIEVVAEAKGRSVNIYGSGHPTVSFGDLSPTNDITSVISGEFAAGIVGKPIKKETFKCGMTLSNKGRVISSDCEDQQFLKTPYFPEGAVKVGSAWSHLDEFYDQDVGKIQFISHDRLSKFVLVNNRICARVELEGRGISSGLKDAHISLKGFYYYDLILRQTTYAETQISINGKYGQDNFSIKFDMFFKLDLEQSLFKRPIIPHVASPTRRSGQEISPVGLSNVFVVSETADIMSGGGIDFSILTSVKRGDKLVLLGEYREWFYVRLENGKEGWINSKFVK